MSKKNKDRKDKRRAARAQNQLSKKVPVEQKKQGKKLVAILLSMVAVSAALILYLQH